MGKRYQIDLDIIVNFLLVKEILKFPTYTLIVINGTSVHFKLLTNSQNTFKHTVLPIVPDEIT